jgi:decaprenylphospho-beta-D-ribofuranose 2-oxidase
VRAFGALPNDDQDPEIWAGDQAGGSAADPTSSGRIQAFDVDSGTVVAQPGVTFHELLSASLPFGWLPPVLPENSGMSLGEALETDLHGRNHAGAGSFGHHVRWLDLRAAGGALVRLSRVRDPQGFWASIGGLGLTGTIERMALDLQESRTAYVRCTRLRTNSLEHTLEVFDEVATRQWFDPHLHVVARLDDPTGSQSFGPGVVELLSPAEMDELPPRWGDSGLAMPEPVQLRAVRTLPQGIKVAKATVSEAGGRVGERIRWRAGRGQAPPQTSVVHLAKVLCRDDVPRSWTTAFPGSPVRYEFLVPETAGWLLGHVLQMLQRVQVRPSGILIKRLGAGNVAPLSFARPGWAMALELPGRASRLMPALDTADRMMVRHGGRVRLAGAGGRNPGLVPEMYPRLDGWRAVRARLNASDDLERSVRPLGLV